jgi:tetratricopeptide (TPR) repeat protein
MEEPWMKIRYGLVLVMAIGLGLVGCASGGGGDVGSSDRMSSLGGGGAGVSPRNTDFTRAAESAIEAAEDAASDADARGHYDQAVSAAQSAITEDPQNPLAHRLAGVAAMGLGDYAGASAHFDEAQDLRPLYEFDLVGIREAAWLDLYQEASPYVQSGDYATAAAHFENANLIYAGRPEVMITLGRIYAQLREHDKAVDNFDAAVAFMESDAAATMDSVTVQDWQEQMADLPMLRAQVLADAGRFEEAVGTYRQMSAANPDDIELKRGLAAILLEMGNRGEATQIYDEMLTMPGLMPEDFFAIGVGFYQGSDYERSAAAFEGAATASVNDRDAIEMWARSLQLDSMWTELRPVTERWVDLDPNSQNAYLIMAQSANQNGDVERTQMAIQAVDGFEVTVNDLQLSRFGNGGASVSGSLANKALEQGASVSLRFTFYANDGTPIGSVTESVSAGMVDMGQVFQIQFDSAEQVGGYGYEILG